VSLSSAPAVGSSRAEHQHCSGPASRAAQLSRAALLIVTVAGAGAEERSHRCRAANSKQALQPTQAWARAASGAQDAATTSFLSPLVGSLKVRRVSSKHLFRHLAWLFSNWTHVNACNMNFSAMCCAR
jgi:hypothetical protein